MLCVTVFELKYTKSIWVFRRFEFEVRFGEFFAIRVYQIFGFVMVNVGIFRF